MNGLLIFLAGIVNAMPIDQANLEILRKSFQKDIRGALHVSVGNALGDSVYFTIIFNGLAPLFKEVIFRQVISWTGGVMLLCYGLTRVVSLARFLRLKKLFVISTSPLVLGILFSILNPASLITAISILKFIKTESAPFSVMYAPFFLLGGLVWSVVLIILSWIIASRFDNKIAALIDKFSGIVMVLIGLFMLWDGLTGIG